MFASIVVEHPGRAAAALAELAAGQVARSTHGETFVLAPKLRLAFLPSGGERRQGITVLPLPIACSVEQVIEAACRHGFHAEETQRGVIELWIDEFAAIELATPEAAAFPPLLLAA